jgi:cysteinyl-tRNA synthetase, unknown class
MTRKHPLPLPPDLLAHQELLVRNEHAPPERPRRAVRPSGRWPGILRRVLVAGVAVLAVAFAQLPVDRPILKARDGMAPGQVRQWGYQLQNVNARAIPDAIDLLVVDYSRDGSERTALAPREVDSLRRRPDGRDRIVLAYLSIGEAEDYRYYWQRTWRALRPSWLGPENPEWPGNYPVRYWQAGWRDIVMQPRLSLFGRIREAWQPAVRPYLDRIVEAGFDGVFLDRVDAFDVWKGENPQAEADMIGFVGALSAYAKRRRPGFLVVPQNGEELLRSDEYRRVIDAIAKEDLLFGSTAPGQPNATAEVRRATADLIRLKADNRPVFVVEYVSDPAHRAQSQRQLAALGFVVQFAERELRHAPESPTPQESATPARPQ